LNELVQLFENLEMEGKKVVKKVFRKDEIYHGPYLDKAPDLVLLGEKGFNLRGGLNKDIVFDKDEVFTGKHSYDDAFLFVKASNAQEAVPDEPSVVNILGILNKIR
jgi:predicted AlkP superfamily phosphohydrolase/phosphomutase